ncbi:hypothetical protein [Leeia oryzae]|uniref:hypothetical protein n=1 Tax=Leeia oryzae TaxID=356662 RepID=UPI000377BD3C|nr:hypothetical protein [Leeia oryzae]
MKRHIYAFLSLATLLLTLTFPCISHADYQDANSGCRLVLCLANPNGPTSVAECRPDINELYHQLTQEDPFIPSCDSAKAKGTYFQMRQDHYALCPAGTIDSRTNGMTGRYLQAGTGTISFNAPATGYWNAFNKDGDTPPTALACVSTEKPKAYSVCSDKLHAGSSWGKCEGGYTTVYRYHRIVWQVFHPNPQVADVYIDNRLFQRARLYERSNGDVEALIE